MSDKLYSRRKLKIKIPNIRKMNPLKLLLLIVLFTIIISVALFLRSAYPVFKGSCETAAASKGNKIITEPGTTLKTIKEKYTVTSANTLICAEFNGQPLSNE